MKTHKKHCQGGFTLIEMLVVSSVVVILATSGAPVYNTLRNRDVLLEGQSAVVSGLRLAQARSQSGENDATWGVKLLSGSVVVFSGSSYASRNTAFDLSMPMSRTISLSGTDEYVFSLVTGLPVASGSVILSNNFSSKTISINAKGMVSY